MQRRVFSYFPFNYEIMVQIRRLLVIILLSQENFYTFSNLWLVQVKDTSLFLFVKSFRMPGNTS